MSVHAPHTHHDGKRTWKSNAREFLMLFLAIFCGSIAEYYMEHKIESDRAKRYMVGMINDLKADTAMMRGTITYANAISIGLDSLQNQLYHFTNNKENVLSIYKLNFTYLKWILPDFNDKTATQLRYSGNFRLIKKPNVSDSISNYWIGTGTILRNANLFIDKSAIAQEAGNLIFNRQYVTYPDKAYIGFTINEVLVSPDATLMTSDKNTLISYANRLGRMTDISEHYMIPLLKTQIEKGRSLIQLIKEEYHIE